MPIRVLAKHLVTLFKGHIMEMTITEYYTNNFKKWVDLLAVMIHDREEAEDRVQDVFVKLLEREEKFLDLIKQGEIDKYLYCVMANQRAQVFRKQYKQPPMVSIDTENIDFLSSLREGAQDMTTTEGLELEDFYETAVALLQNSRRPIGNCGFGTIGEVWQYIFVQYARNGRTLTEIGDLLTMTHQNVSQHYSTIKAILLPAVEEFIGRKLDSSKK